MREIFLAIGLAVGGRLAAGGVKVLELVAHARVLGVLAEVEVGAVGDALEFPEAGAVNGKRYSTSLVPAPSLA